VAPLDRERDRRDLLKQWWKRCPITEALRPWGTGPAAAAFQIKVVRFVAVLDLARLGGPPKECLPAADQDPQPIHPGVTMSFAGCGPGRVNGVTGLVTGPLTGGGSDSARRRYRCWEDAVFALAVQADVHNSYIRVIRNISPPSRITTTCVRVDTKGCFRSLPLTNYSNSTSRPVVPRKSHHSGRDRLGQLCSRVNPVQYPATAFPAINVIFNDLKWVFCHLGDRIGQDGLITTEMSDYGVLGI
jgi:hypothetical protein